MGSGAVGVGAMFCLFACWSSEILCLGNFSITCYLFVLLAKLLLIWFILILLYLFLSRHTAFLRQRFLLNNYSNMLLVNER